MATLIDPIFLHTLPVKELLSGFAEMLKHALIASQDEWVKLLQIVQKELPHDQFVEELKNTRALKKSIAIKENVVSQDPHEAGLRKILNFGHTVGHAIESAALENNTLPHGYCVLWGMVAEVYLSIVHAGCPREVLQQLTQIMLQYYGRPECNCKQRELLIQRMYQDKKNSANKKPNFTLLRNVGDPLINQHLNEKDINEALEYLFSL
jgi:3-dehydroquinate synthase